VYIARYLGAEVFATAGSEEQRVWLRSQGITQVMDFCSADLAQEVCGATGGTGVDVVLNASDAFFEASLSALATDGRFLDLGSRDLAVDRTLGLALLQKSLSYSVVDLLGIAERRPERFAALLHEVMGLLARGALPALPVETAPISRAAQAFRKMAQAQPIGKLVLTLGEPEARIRVPRQTQVALRADSSYLLTGGLGGLGLSVAGWLAEQGAGHLVLVSRSGAATAEQRAAVAGLSAKGAQVTVAKADVAQRAELERILSEIAASGTPLRGIIHAAGVLDDGMLVQQTPARFRRVLAPKVQGALHLHELTQQQELDFFVMYSSASGLLGSPGQGNYAAANTFLDALAHYRRAQGLPALSIDWGGFSEVGMAAAQDNRGARAATRGVRSLTPEQGLRALGRLLQGNDPQVGVVPLNLRQWAGFYQAAAAARRLSRLWTAQQTAVQPKGERDLLERLAAAEPAARSALIQEVVRAQAAHVLRIPESELDLEAPLASLGLDSLMGLELRNRIETVLGIQVSATLLWTYPTVVALSRHLATQIGLGESGDASRPKEPEKETGKEPEKEARIDDEMTQIGQEGLLALLGDVLTQAKRKGK
jgi:NADPH:quinone reductase-like Zn-dependent oxidoreductase/acyl carrier protein